MRYYIEAQGWELVKSYRDIGSGLNENRKGLLQLIRELPVLQPAKIVISYSDRLARFGTNLIQAICNFFQTEIVCNHDKKQEITLEQQLTTDLIAMVTSFAGKLHRSRRGKQTRK